MIIKNNDNNKYEDLEIEIKKTLNLKSTTVPVVIGALRLVAYVAGVKGRRGRGRGNLGARGRKERNACKDAIVSSVFPLSSDSERENSDWSELIKCQSST